MNFARPAGSDPAGLLHLDLNFSRASLFACAGVLAALNAQASQIIATLGSQPPAAALLTLGGISAVIWFAMYAALKVGFEADASALSRRDAVVLGAAVLLAFLPISLAAHAGLLLCAAYVLTTSRPGSSAGRVGFVLLALTGPLIWGRILLRLFAAPLLNFDAHVVASIIGTPVDGNTVQFANSTKQFLIGAPCSSVHNISLAVVLWTTAAVLFRVKPDARYIGCGIAMVALMFTLNIARLSAIGLFPGSFEFLHIGAGAEMFGWAGLIGAGLIAGLGVVHASARQR
ncbi:hypothetical protein [Sphingomonas sp.]|uniref:hypothetical protein n=1 Tax=Sphingomonas sp. TaxID=28214 RepID=UPI002DB67C70|nr:hypothetical protein [Sphingomonas sp.]HEU4968921.1 hypothetical protein [Sphingomonas sp.]